MRPRRAHRPSATPLLGWGAEQSAEALRAERADLLARLEHSHRWRSRRHQALLDRLRIVTEQLLHAECETEVARRDRILARN